MTLLIGCEAPSVADMADGAIRLQTNPSPEAPDIPLDIGSACLPVDGVIDHPDDHYAVDGNCVLSIKFKALAAHGTYRIHLDAYTPIKFQRTHDQEIIGEDEHAISWVTRFFSGAEVIKTVPFTFYPSNAPSKKTMSGIYGIKVCSTHLETEVERCTIAQIDRPDRTWQAIGADWRVGQTQLAYYFAEQSATESWLFVRLESPVDGFEPEMTIELQPGLRIMTEPAEYKPYYVQVNAGGQSAEIAPFHIGAMFKGDQRIVVLRVQHDGRTEGKLPVRVTVRSDTHNFWEDSTVRLATSRNADGSLVLTQQDNPDSQTGIAEPPVPTITPAAPSDTPTETPAAAVTVVATVTPAPNAATPIASKACAPKCNVHACHRCGNGNAPSNLAWTHQFVAPYTMHRYDAYTNHQQAAIYEHISLQQFLHWFLVYNPHVNPSHAVLYEGQTYNFPTVNTTSPR